MEITRITEHNREAFSYLFPEEFVFREDQIMLGAVNEDKEAVSCLIFSVLADNLATIDWIYTDPAFRERGAATDLLETVTLFLAERSVKRLHIAFTDEEGTLELFLQDHGFAVTEVEDVYEVPVSDLIYSVRADQLLKAVKSPKGLFTLEEDAYSPDVEQMLKEDGLGPEELNGISKKYSQILVDKNGKLAGCLLVRETEDGDLEVLYFRNEEKKAEVSTLLFGLYRALAKEDPGEKKLLFSDPFGQSIRFAENLTGMDREAFRTRGILQGICLL